MCALNVCATPLLNCKYDPHLSPFEIIVLVTLLFLLFFFCGIHSTSSQVKNTLLEHNLAFHYLGIYFLTTVTAAELQTCPVKRHR